MTATDVAEFFVDFIQNNLLGSISNRHLLIADQEPLGVFHPSCLKLAEMASTAVDFPKTGIKVTLREWLLVIGEEAVVVDDVVKI